MLTSLTTWSTHSSKRRCLRWTSWNRQIVEVIQVRPTITAFDQLIHVKWGCLEKNYYFLAELRAFCSETLFWSWVDKDWNFFWNFISISCMLAPNLHGENMSTATKGLMSLQYWFLSPPSYLQNSKPLGKDFCPPPICLISLFKGSLAP